LKYLIKIILRVNLIVRQCNAQPVFREVREGLHVVVTLAQIRKLFCRCLYSFYVTGWIAYGLLHNMCLDTIDENENYFILIVTVIIITTTTTTTTTTT